MKASVVVLSYNTKKMTLKCLECLERSVGVDLDIIVFDNGSTDGTSQAVRKEHPQVNLIENAKNIGFAAGNNIAIKKAKNDLVILLNSDAFVFEDSIFKWINWMKINPHADICGCQLWNRDGTLQRSYGYFPSLRRIFLMMVGVDNLPILRNIIDSIHIRSEKKYERDKRIDWVTGAAVAVKKEVYEKTGGIDENYFMYGEEMEWMYRAKKSGYQCWYTPASRIVHLGGASSSSRDVAVMGEMKGWIYWFSKHNHYFERKLLPWILILGCIIRSFLKPQLKNAYVETSAWLKKKIFDQKG